MQLGVIPGDAGNGVVVEQQYSWQRQCLCDANNLLLFYRRKQTYLAVLMKVIILLIEGKKTDHPSYFSGLIKKGFQVDTAPSGSAALEY